MAWTAPTIRFTGDLVTASIWNGDVVNNLLYLHGDAGVVVLASGVQIPSANSYIWNADTYLVRTALGVPGGGSGSDTMAFHRHPYGNRRHMESGQVVATSLASFGTTNASVTFTDAFAVVSAITTGVSSSGDTGANTPVASISGGCWRSATSTTGFTLYMRNHSNGTLTLVFEWMAEGTD